MFRVVFPLIIRRTDVLKVRREDKEEDISSYWMTLRKREDPEN
jgi:hypothetical protein